MNKRILSMLIGLTMLFDTFPITSLAQSVTQDNKEQPMQSYMADDLIDMKTKDSKDSTEFSRTVNSDEAAVVSVTLSSGETTSYTTMEEAFRAVKAQSAEVTEVELKDDVTLAEALEITDGEFTLALGNHKISSNNAANLTIDGGQVTLKSESNGSVSCDVVVNGGMLNIEDFEGTLSSVNVSEGTLNVSDGSFATLYVSSDNANVVLSGGMFDNISVSNKSLPELLKKGYGYCQNGNFLVLSELQNQQSIKESSPITVQQCHNHDFTGMNYTCQYCGLESCAEHHWGEDGKCTVCGSAYARGVFSDADKVQNGKNVSSLGNVKNEAHTKHECDAISLSSPAYCKICGERLWVTVENLSDPDRMYYIKVEDAIRSVKKGDEEKIISSYMPDDYTFNEDIEVRGLINCWSITSKKFCFAEGKSIVVKDGGYFSTNTYVGAVTNERGGRVDLQDRSEIGTLTVYDTSSIELQDGKIQKIIIKEPGKTVGDILFSTQSMPRTYKYTTDGKWVTDDELAQTEIENVQVVGIPLKNIGIKAEPTEQIYDGTNTAKLTALAEPEFYYSKNDITYKWYKDDRLINGATKSQYITEVLNPGNYTYKCEMTLDGYTKTATVEVKVNLPKAQFTVDCKAKEGLIYNGEAQELLEIKGTTNQGKIKYSLDGKNWSEEIPKAINAVKYIVHYKIEGDANHKDSDEKTLDCSITPAIPKKNTQKQTTARIRKGRTLADADVKEGEWYGADGKTVLKGKLTWVDSTKIMRMAGTESMTFTPDDTNYQAVTFDVAVKVYSSGSSSSSSSSGTTHYTVSFDTNGSNAIDSVEVTSNNALSEPKEPVKDGFKFDGWFRDKALKNKYNFSEKVTESFTLYAKWTKMETELESTDKLNDSDTQISNTKNLFDDVDEEDWYYGDVKNVVEKGLFKGMDSKTFAPNHSITRGMFVTVLYRAEGEPAVNKSIPFADVTADSYYANAVIWAEQNGIVTGVFENKFAPTENITREQIATIMFRYAKYKGVAPTGAWAIRLDYKDLENISDYATEAVMYCKLKGIMQGKNNNNFAPHDKVTRAEMAAILNRFIEETK